MKRLHFIIALLFILITTAAFAARRPKQINYSPAFKSGDKVIQMGLGFGVPGSYGDSTTVPPVALSFDMAVPIAKMKLPFSFGGIIGYSRDVWEQNIVGYKTEITYNYILIGARVLFHFNLVNNMDFYAGLMMGYNIVTSSVETNVPGGNVSADEGYLAYGELVGLRYFFTDTVAVYVEAGYTFGYINGGLAFKF